MEMFSGFLGTSAKGPGLGSPRQLCLAWPVAAQGQCKPASVTERNALGPPHLPGQGCPCPWSSPRPAGQASRVAELRPHPGSGKASSPDAARGLGCRHSSRPGGCEEPASRAGSPRRVPRCWPALCLLPGSAPQPLAGSWPCSPAPSAWGPAGLALPSQNTCPCSGGGSRLSVHQTSPFPPGRSACSGEVWTQA